MKKNSGLFVTILTIFFVSLLVWNLFIMNNLKEEELQKNELEEQIYTLRGTIDVLNYDLITSRDSVRILNNELDQCIQKVNQ
ncbi:MAG: hypothetical protein R3277_05535 [Brumimicrobium sp.]|nr:hypothetical protein [Brumimicrobium sp.]